ncbi:MAG: AAA domain-containing protein [Rubrivivax sp.]
MTDTLAAGAPLVLDLLNYIEQVEKLKSKPAFTVPTEFFVAYQHELKGLPELQFNLQVDGDDVWMRLPRLQEIAPPELDEQLKPWVTLPKSPEKSPELRSEAVTYEGKREVARAQLKDHPEVQEAFDWYVEYQWSPWAAAERPRRKTIARYNQLFSLQQAISSEGAETPLELVWGIGYAAWKKDGFGMALKHPLLVQACEISLNEKTFDLEVRPRDVEPRLEADCYAEMELPGVTQLEAYWRSALATGANRVNPFEASTFDGTLKAAVGHLDPTGTYEVRTDDVTPPAPSDKLTIANTWVLFGRKRSGDIFLEDIRRLKKKVEEAEELPSVIRSFVERGDSTVKVRPEQPFRGLSTSDAGSQAMELYFPMAYNDEQVSIVQKLHANDGVVVQGPPGTGKTHTIANVICHYLAQGKRVLVTAKGESALAVLQEKLPERIRPLSVALLSDERDGMKQFEHSIQTIASSVAGLNPTRAVQNIAAAEEKLNQLHAKIAHVDRTVAAYASKHMQSYPFHGREVMPEELSKVVLEQAEAHQWFDDEPPATNDGTLPFDDAAINALRRARITVVEDLPYLGCTLPCPDSFPVWADMLGLHRDLVRAKSIDASVSQGAILALVDSRLETFEKAQALVKFLEDRMTLKAKVAASRQPWLEALGQRFADMQPTDPVLMALVSLCAAVRKLERQRRQLLAKAVDLPADAEVNEDFGHAVGRLVAGKSAFALPFGTGVARKLVAAVTVSGVAPSGKPEWELVQELLTWRREARKVLARWSSLSAEFGLEAPGPGVEPALKKVATWQSGIEEMRYLTFDFDAKLHSRLEEVFGKQSADRMWDGGEPFVATAYSSLQAHVDKGRLAYAMKRVQELVRKLEGHSGCVVNELRSFLTALLGRTAAEESVLQTTWLALQAELSRLTALKPSLAEIERVAAAIELAGATKWAERLRTEPATVDMDTATPATWLDAWNWRQAVMFLDRIDGHHKMRELFDERRALTTSLARTYQDLVAEKTWLGVFNNSPASVRQALQAYLNAVQAMGSGTGVRAVRHRKTAREAMLRAYRAVPCWVLPQWRVSETIPPEVGLFDLVIIDEASQSDIWALPALLRGQKVLVVGDHTQVSPSAVGTAEETIKELTNRFLTNQPHGSEMTPDKSIYDLARVVFAGNSVMLKEHFRCVPAIIEFSNREFYQGDIRPLRVPKAHERLDPPLVDVYVKGGFRKGDINDPEAKAIVDEIEAILADPQFDGRSIGVVTLLGTTQAARIQELVSERISPIDVVERRIAIGPPPVFQGRERDIMMVSMVLGPGDRSAANRADMHQRFNVALSRARDRMYLFRSVAETEFKEDSLNGKVISHFKQPFRQDAKKVQALRERCESGFELEMFDELVKRGFRVEPQLPCGGYRIDFVVEGNEGRRLAVECDGDRFHGPGQWQDDMARQRVLERAGWTFWRCFASSFVRRRQEVLEDLMRTLERLGIEPLGAESVDSTVWVHYKEVDPYGVEEGQEVA